MTVIWAGYHKTLASVAVAPRAKGKSVLFLHALTTLAEADPRMSYALDPESGQTLIGSSDVDHLPVLLERLQQELALDIGTPQVDYRETICRPVTGEYTHQGPAGSQGQFARVKLRFDPLPRNTGYDFTLALSPSHPLQDYADAIADAVDYVRHSGVIAGYALTDLRVTLIDGACHETGSHPTAFRKAARQCYLNALPKAEPLLLEPVMTARITVAADFMGDVIGMLTAGRVSVTDMSQEDGLAVIQAKGPLVSLLPYAVPGLMPSAATPGWPGFSITLDFAGYEPAPRRPDDHGPSAGALALRTGARLA